MNIGPRIKSHIQLLLLLVLWSCRKKINRVLYYNRGGLSRQRTENQACISFHLQADQFRKSFTTHVVSLHSQNLLLAVSVHMQNCSHSTYILKLCFNNNGSFIFLFRNKKLYYTLVLWFLN